MLVCVTANDRFILISISILEKSVSGFNQFYNRVQTDAIDYEIKFL